MKMEQKQFQQTIIKQTQEINKWIKSTKFINLANILIKFIIIIQILSNQVVQASSIQIKYISQNITLQSRSSNSQPEQQQQNQSQQSEKEEYMITIDECIDAFYINQSIHNNPFLLSLNLLNQYKFHRISYSIRQLMIANNNIIVIVDEQYRMILFTIKPSTSNNNSIHLNQLKLIPIGSFDLKNTLLSHSNSNDNQQVELLFKIFKYSSSTSSSDNSIFIMYDMKLYNFNLANPTIENIQNKKNEFYSFSEFFSQKIDDISFYEESGIFLIVTQGEVYIYKIIDNSSNNNNMNNNQNGENNKRGMKMIDKIKGLQYDNLYITKIYLYQNTILLVDQQNGIFFYSLITATKITDTMKSDKMIKLPLQILVKNTLDIHINKSTVIVVHKPQNNFNSTNFAITEYFYEIKNINDDDSNDSQIKKNKTLNNKIQYVKQIQEKYSDYYQGQLTSDKFYFISNYNIHYFYVLQNYSSNNDNISNQSKYNPSNESIGDQDNENDDFVKLNIQGQDEDKMITNSLSLRIHNFILINQLEQQYYSISSPLLLAYQNEQLYLFELEISSPILIINHNSLNEQNQSNQFKITCGLFDCSKQESILQQNNENNYEIKTKIKELENNEEEYSTVLRDYCLMTFNILWSDQEIKDEQLFFKKWFSFNNITNIYFYFGITTSILLIIILPYFIYSLFNFFISHYFLIHYSNDNTTINNNHYSDDNNNDPLQDINKDNIVLITINPNHPTLPTQSNLS